MSGDVECPDNDVNREELDDLVLVALTLDVGERQIAGIGASKRTSELIPFFAQ